jgi:rhodanese-related sulfurtransferase
MAEITITETDRRRSAATILDVRGDFEIAEGMIPGALHIPTGQLQARFSELDPTVPVIAVCRSGNRSARVADALNGTGFTADTMAGGIAAWACAGHPTTRPPVPAAAPPATIGPKLEYIQPCHIPPGV